MNPSRHPFSLPAISAALLALLAHAPAVSAGTWVDSSYTNSAGTRAYRLWVPTGYVTGTRVPLLVALHGCGQTPNDFAGLTRLNGLADAQKFLVLYPTQYAGANASLCWNWFNPTHQARDAGEPSIIKGMVDRVKTQYSVQGTQVYTLGLSAGGGMAQVLANCYSDVFAAAGVHSGPMYKAVIATSQSLATGSPYDPRERGFDGWVCGTRATNRRVPHIVFQGSADTTFAPVNMTQLVTQVAQMNDFADDGLNNASVRNVPTSTTTGSAGGRAFTLRSYAYGGYTIALHYDVTGLAHTWSGGNASFSGGVDTAGPDATTLMWNFLKTNFR